MVIAWFRFAFRQIAAALALVTGILLLSEILLPASVLPYFNLHILVLVTVVVAVSSGEPPAPLSGGLRVVAVVPLALLLLAYAWLMFGTSTSGLMLFGALVVVLVGVIIALCHSREGGNPVPVNKVTQSQAEEIIEVEITEEVDVFMR